MTPKATTKWKIRDPFAGEFIIPGETLEEAVEEFYRDIPPQDRPAYIWCEGEMVPVPGGQCTPTF